MKLPPRLAVLLCLTVVGLAGCGGDDTAEDQRPASGPTRHHHSEPSGDTSPSASESASAQPEADQVTVPVYFTGSTPAGSRLYREFRRVDAADPLGAALTLA